eukprot:CAMPEP_0117055122 /NCGR_PEP_ID=MMETSP0472-20121206/38205_1 /TAXON_ID=693140 ORGANISM="Tiarina fusus, Strain LIS" /NCGR_SAMPLE_ID=MMETSP0472 /ASSEMBLY_ACC=CAM_ASM_000603 /LENGTH=155 /DNA_ID=CAMNT_0004770981 /DNA_START=80 /DNA_END=547 /DNA_ORIENTATION=+
MLTRFVVRFLFLVASASAFTSPPTASVTKDALTRRYLQQTVEAAITEAQQICASEGAGSEACRVAWDIVEELEAADSHKNTVSSPANTSPDFAVLMDGFDILCAKIDGKMEQLKATSSKFHELGASDPALGLEDLYERAEEMQKALAHVQRSLRQ